MTPVLAAPLRHSDREHRSRISPWRLIAGLLIPAAALSIGCGSGDNTEIEVAPSFHSGRLSPTPAPSPSVDPAVVPPAPIPPEPVPPAPVPPAPVVSPIALAPPEEKIMAGAFGTETSFITESTFLPGATETTFLRKIPELPPLDEFLRPKVVEEKGIALEHPQVLSLEPQQVGGAAIERLASPSFGAAGGLSAGRVNDYVLRNEHVILVFAAAIRREAGEPITILENRPPGSRLPGSLVDVITPKNRADFLSEFTQAFTVESQGHFFVYDSAEFVKRDAGADGVLAAAGLRLTGSTIKDNNEVRIQTTYWLSAGSTKLEVETAILAGDPEAEIADIFHGAPGVLLSDIYGPPGPTPELREVEWLAGHAGELSIGFVAPGGLLAGNFLRSQARVVAAKKEGAKLRPLRKRVLVFGEGNYSSVTDQIFSMPGFAHPVGTFKGTVKDKENDEAANEGWVDIFWYDRKIGPDSRKIFTRAKINPDSTFSATLPVLDPEEKTGRYFVGAGSRSRRGGLSNIGIVVQDGQTVDRELSIGSQGTLTVKCRDSKTNEPLACRVRFEPVPPAPSGRFNSVVSPKGYLDSFYAPREGATIPMSKGVYTLTALHGISYELGQVDVEIDWNRETVAEILLDKTSPAPGWMAPHIGVMTNATPSCQLSAEDQVLMTTGEGLQWIISGDFETITDFAPVIEKMGCKDILGSSRGFRTALPKKPEWGEFLLFPIAAGAPDPKAAREQWKDMTDATEFFALLRRLYPGALIESCLPYADPLNKTNKTSGVGYFYHPGWTVYEMAYNDNQRVEKIDFGVDAVNLFSPRGDWSYYLDKDFFFINTQNSRIYIPAPVSESRTAYLGEPGWPRLLLQVDENDVQKVTEEKLIGAMKAGRWQITTGPFIEFNSDGRVAGDRYHPDSKKANVRFRITAPYWAPTSNIDMCKDGVMLWRNANNVQAEPEENLRYEKEEGVELTPELRGDSDTMLSGAAWSVAAIDTVARGATGVSLPSLSWTGPIYCDTNGNGKYDPPIYRDRGK